MIKHRIPYSTPRFISREPLRFLEIHYKGGKEGDKAHGLVGKGVTFDS